MMDKVCFSHSIIHLKTVAKPFIIMFVQSIKDCQMSLDAYRLLLSYVDSVVDSVPLEELVQFYRDQLYGDLANKLHTGQMTLSELQWEIEQEAPHLLD